MNERSEQIEQLKDIIKKSRHAVAITGAGISFSSGGMSFDDTNPEGMRRMMILGSEEGLRNQPEEYYAALDEAFLHSMFAVGPSPAHLALARLEEQGTLAGIITTNVDCLHTMAGSKNVLEIQGSLQVNQCVDCGAQYNDYTIWQQGKVPECPACGGKIWPFPFYTNVGLDQAAVRKARLLIGRADLILIIGANGAYLTSYWSFRRKRAVVVQINPGSTWFDRFADLNLRMGADEALVWILDEDGGTDVL